MSATQSHNASAAGNASLIQGVYQVDCGQPLAGLGGGLQAFSASDHRNPRRSLMAVQVMAGAPPRAMALAKLSTANIENLITPVAHGPAVASDGREAWFVISARPPGPPVWDAGASLPQRPWAEGDLLDFVLRPAALVLDQLAHIGITHRAIRPNNMFRASAGQPVTLGEAWSSPPAYLQSAVFEPPYAAMCRSAGRGEGTIADDVYSLGVLLLMLATGRVLMEGLDDDTVIQRKLDRGSYTALVGDLRLPSTIADLVRGMLAEDPEHRTQPLLLIDSLAARSRRVAARPAQRAKQALELGSLAAWEARTLSFAIARAPDVALRLLRTDVIDKWLRRALGDPGLASRVADAVHRRSADDSKEARRADAILVMRTVTILDPLTPLCWGTLALFPDGIGPLLASAVDGGGDMLAEKIEDLIQAEAPLGWADARPERLDVSLLQLDNRQQRFLLRPGNWSGGFARLRYTLNSLLPCRSPMVGTACVARIQELLPALDRYAAATGAIVIDREMAAFISARFSSRIDADITIISTVEDPDIDPPGHRGLAQLRVLSKIANTEPNLSRPALAAAVLKGVIPALAQWHSRTLRAQLEKKLLLAAQRGSLVEMLNVLQDSTAREADTRASQTAASELRHIEETLESLGRDQPQRTVGARTTGQEVATAIAIMALAASAVFTVM